MNDVSVTFVCTNSYDGTTDLLVDKLGSDSVFRFNFDLWRDYKVFIDPNDFVISNAAGRILSPKMIAKVYWRKPLRTRELFPDQHYDQDELYVEEELWYAMRELVNVLWQQNKLVLVEPRAEERIGKLVQMREASRYFSVPPWKIVCGGPVPGSPGQDRVIKSLTSERVSKGSVIYTTRVDERKLDSSSPWFVQNYVDAEADVTVVYVRGMTFAFELAREAFVEQTADWRQVALDQTAQNWKVHALPAKVAASIQSLMSDLTLDYGRIDFLLCSGEHIFLEVNCNGEWGWLDPLGRYGLLDQILSEISPSTPVHPIPTIAALRSLERA